MNSKQIEAQFSAMGARFRTRIVPENRRGQSDYAMDIQRDRRGELFELRVPDSLSDQLEVNVLQVCPHERHLLLLVRRDRPERTLDRFLCGHDEREWFIAAVPGRVSSVAQAMESLKPVEVQTAQAQAGLTARQRHSRNNRAFRRQGEWFFVPTPALSPDPKLILRDEPIRRGSGKAHFVEMLYREGGTQVYVCGQYPNGIIEAEYRRLVGQDPSRVKWGWRRMQRDAAVYARGQIRHPDHRTITLSGWHRVLMNTETHSRTMRQMAFLD
jgi:hypothetical protein